jgi:hypothetical protein
LDTLFETGYSGFVSGEFMPVPDADTGAQRGIDYLLDWIMGLQYKKLV